MGFFSRRKEKKMVQRPVYVINGFLDSGKSSFFSYTIAQPYFQTSGTTLLIVCEEGEVEYGERLLRQTNTVLEVFENDGAGDQIQTRESPDRIQRHVELQEFPSPQGMETGAADHGDRCVHILCILHKYEIASRGAAS